MIVSNIRKRQNFVPVLRNTDECHFNPLSEPAPPAPSLLPTMSSQVKQSPSPTPAFDSGYESRNESFPKPSGESRMSAKKARSKAGERQRRDKVAHYMGELREALPPTMRPGFKGIGYAGGQLAVMENGMYQALYSHSQADNSLLHII